MPEDLQHAIDLGDIPEGSPPTVEQQRQMLIALGALDPVEEAAQRAEDAATRAETAADRAEVAEGAASGHSEAAALSATEAQESATLSDASAVAAAGAATAAGLSETAAADSANEASQSAGLAADEANRADDAATIATTQAGIATEKASDAADAASTATDAANIAVTKAGESSTARDESVSARDEAVPAAATATTKASEASTSADNAAQSESNALDSENSAGIHAATAEAAALSASASAALVDPLRMARAGGITFDGVSGTALAPIDGTIEGKVKTLCFVGSGSPRVAYGGYTTGGWWFYRSGDNNLYTLRLQQAASQAVYAEITWPPPPAGINHFAIIIDRTDENSVSAELFINGESQGLKSAAGIGVYSDGSGNALGLGARGNGTIGFAASTMRNVQLFDGALSPASIASIAGSGGAIIPVADRVNLLGNLALDDGNNYQCRDSSAGGNHLVLTATGVTHSIPRTPWTLSATRTGSGWIAGDRPMLSTGAEIEYASVECSAAGTVSLGYNSANGAVHFTAAHPGGGARIRVPIADTSPGVTDRRLYLAAPGGATVSISLTGNIR